MLSVHVRVRLYSHGIHIRKQKCCLEPFRTAQNSSRRIWVLQIMCMTRQRSSALCWALGLDVERSRRPRPRGKNSRVDIRMYDGHSLSPPLPYLNGTLWPCISTDVDRCMTRFLDNGQDANRTASHNGVSVWYQARGEGYAWERGHMRV